MRLRPAPLLLLLVGLAVAACDSSDSNDSNDSDGVADLGDTVFVSFEGRLDDGTIFNPRTQASFRLDDSVIPGFRDGIVGMRVGESRTFVVPPEEGYGDQQRGPIPPNSTLTFEVELLGVR
ncbi:FKBP-type peptidyl-prolyl cis-trans isomerase [Rubrivirga sp. S365]|uniref:Peptidyl-prolyl cis-trans isomerase n=1 Tax=Rubrivirga litoralis TaxID=3075598 RepID=A0ABU3BRS3_9BACT|nr:MULTISPECIES: FKBP-type peptidyl-prolyl cis-trans isomerase [unclassified Rubrivirga]MDT0631994.1 FKBP-type peptidyl-prolyl cis-trans isomerase [Rubrivirga sp. F394]MDT7855313.1 FKBP-type peptidyl-prolyl cis-trans isomerase [Rubrivirga sp. S365]